MQQSCRISVIQSQNASECDKLKEKLDNLFWDDPYAYSQLCVYCATMKIEQKAKKILAKKGILDKKGDLPITIRKAVYELTTG